MLLVAIEVIRTCCSHGDASFRGILLGLNGSAAVPFKPPQLLTYRRAEKRASVQMKPRLHCAASEQQGVAENKTESWGQRGKGRSSYTRWWMRHLVSPDLPPSHHRPSLLLFSSSIQPELCHSAALHLSLIVFDLFFSKSQIKAGRRQRGINHQRGLCGGNSWVTAWQWRCLSWSWLKRKILKITSPCRLIMKRWAPSWC